MKLHFTKMHGLGNDFVLIDDRKRRIRTPSATARTFCDRRYGIGADQLLLVRNSRTADCRMLIFNADGSEVEMCGNGIRCLARYILENRISERKQLPRKHQSSVSIETPAGIMYIKESGSQYSVDMGEPVLEGRRIPVRAAGMIVNYPIMVKDRTFRVTAVSVGNPHAVIVVNSVRAVPLETYGPAIENHRFFPKKTNTEFIQILNRKNIRMRVWERGAGETTACGTGATASAVATSILGLTGRNVTVHLPGGRLLIKWSPESNHVYMTGPAERVFDGTIEI